MSAFAARAGLIGVSLCALVACGAARAEWLIDGVAGFVHDSNLSRAASADAIRSDYALIASASLGYLWVPSPADVLTIGAAAAAERYGRYRPLDNVAIGVRAYYRHKLAVGADVPYVIASAAIAYDEYRDDLRDGTRGEGVSGDVFELKGAAAWMRASLALPADVEVGARFGVRRGDVESTAHRGLAIFRASDAVAEDMAFGDDELYAYRLRGTTWSAGASLSWALSAHVALNATYTDERTHAAGDIEYRSRIARIAVSFRL